jgi:hypothetical protein
MNQVNLQLPETLHHQLEALARREGVTLDRYILYLLARQVAAGYGVQPVSSESRERDQERFTELLQMLGQASADEIDQAMAEREPVAPEP